MSSQKQTIIKTYTGNQTLANKRYQADTIKMAKQGYFPISQSWAAGTWGFGAFFLALLLCFVLIGFLVFIYMLVVKPAGTLSVNYELRIHSEEKTCPKCAEKVKAAAVACRFCGHEFSKFIYIKEGGTRPPSP